MPGSQYVEEARLALQQAAELPCDEYLTQLVRVHQVGNIIDKTLYQDLSATEAVFPAAVLMAVSHLEKEVEAMKISLPEGLPQQGKENHALSGQLLLTNDRVIAHVLPRGTNLPVQSRHG